MQLWPFPLFVLLISEKKKMYRGVGNGNNLRVRHLAFGSWLSHSRWGLIHEINECHDFLPESKKYRWVVKRSLIWKFYDIHIWTCYYVGSHKLRYINLWWHSKLMPQYRHLKIYPKAQTLNHHTLSWLTGHGWEYLACLSPGAGSSPCVFFLWPRLKGEELV